jgi:hypothetical protein
MPGCLRLPALFDGDDRERYEDVPCLVAEAGTQRPLERLLELRLLELPVVGDGADRRERVHGDVRGIEGLGEDDGTLAPGDRLLPAGCAQAVQGEVGIGPGELATGRQRLEDPHGVTCAAVGLRGPARAPKKLREATQ